jgi:hypothetical protein
MNRFTRFSRRPSVKMRRPAPVRLEVELLEGRNLLSAPPTNVLVNNSAEDTIPMQDTQNETAIVLGANSNIVAAYNDTGAVTYPSFADLAGVGYSVSADAGASFADKGNPPANGAYWAGFDPVLARSDKTGTIFLSDNSINANTFNTATRGSGEQVNIFRSLDNGVSFSAPLNGTPGFVVGIDVADKPWITVDNYPGPGYGNVYLVWTDFNFKNDGSEIDKGIFFTRSTDNGVTWGPSGGVPIAVKPGSNPTEDAWVTVGPDHTVYLFWWDGSNPSENIMIRKSTDQGQTFSNPVTVARLNTKTNLGDLGLTYSNTNTSSFHTSVIPQAAVDPVTGDIYVVYADEPKNSIKDKADIFLSMSSDGGNTWSGPLRVNDDATTTDQWNPAIALTPDGTHLFITSYDRRNDPTNDSLMDRYGVIGTVSGDTVSFASNFRITDVSFPPAFGQDSLLTAFGNTRYMGDYDMATADNNYFYTTWGDNRLPDAFFASQPDVRFAKIPVTDSDRPAVTTASTRTSPAITAGVGTSSKSLNAVLPGPISFPAVFPSPWKPGAVIAVGENTTPSLSVSVQSPSSLAPALPTNRPAHPSARHEIPSRVLEAAFAALDNTFLPTDW